ncbi:MAG: PAS domain S-box protein [Chthoniobacterales bacterium]
MQGNRRLEGTERALREREVTFTALAKVAPVGIMRFDAEGLCNYVNDRWTALAGITIDSAIGSGWQRAVHPEDRPNVVHRWNLLRLKDENFREEYRLCRPDGSMRWVLAEGAPLRSYSGRLLGFIRAVTDITPQQELQQELASARQQLEQRVRERTTELETEMKHREELEKQLLEAKEDEQRRFHEDLHDGLGQYLTGIVFRLSALQRDLEREQSPHAADAGKIAELVNETITQAHDLARGIYPVPLRPDGLVIALRELQQQLCDPQLANCVFECDEPLEIDDPALATHLYRIAQEAVTNAVKYSRASRITIVLRRSEGSAQLTISDDGVGFDLQRAARGNGLGTMQHRARIIAAQFSIESRKSRGTKVSCTFPLGNRTDAEKS